jgi:hypothetical protein
MRANDKGHVASVPEQWRNKKGINVMLELCLPEFNWEL